MVNYKRVVCEVAVLATLACLTPKVVGAPADCDRATLYDQRQNGTENYRLNIDGVVIAVAPADSLLAAASDIDFNDLFDLEELNELQQKPKPPEKPLLEPKPQDAKPEEDKPQDGKPGEPAKPEETPLSDVSLSSDTPGQKKDAGASNSRKQEKAQRLKHRLANILMPLLRRTRHH